MARRWLAVLLSIVTALGPVVTPAVASTDAHCHEPAALVRGHDTAGLERHADRTADHSTHQMNEPGLRGTHTGMDSLAHHPESVVGGDDALDGAALDCGCDCACATGSGCTILACVPVASLLIEQLSGDRPDSLADANHARGRGPPPSPPPI